MENIDPAVFDMVNRLLTEGGEQWQLLAQELAAKAWMFVYVGASMFGLSLPFWGVSYLTRNKRHEGVPYIIAAAVLMIVGIFLGGINLGDALAPMNSVLENLVGRR